MTMRLAGQRVLITGAATGQGRATALRMAAEGADVFVLDVREDLAAEVAAACVAARPGARAGWRKTDVSRAAEVQAAVDAAATALGGIDALINNAGIYASEAFLEIPEESWDRMLAVDLKGPFLVAQRAARTMVAAGRGGAIVNTASMYGLIGETADSCAHYCAAKAGVIGLTKQMAVELAAHDIRVNAIAPGLVDTPQSAAWKADTTGWDDYIRTRIPLRRAARPEDIAGLHCFLISADAAFITGEVIVIDGGQLAT